MKPASPHPRKQPSAIDEREASMRLFARDVMPRFVDIPPLRDPLALDLTPAS